MVSSVSLPFKAQLKRRCTGCIYEFSHFQKVDAVSKICVYGVYSIAVDCFCGVYRVYKYTPLLSFVYIVLLNLQSTSFFSITIYTTGMCIHSVYTRYTQLINSSSRDIHIYTHIHAYPHTFFQSLERSENHHIIMINIKM